MSLVGPESIWQIRSPRLSNLPNVPRVIRGRASIESRSFWLTHDSKFSAVFPGLSLMVLCQQSPMRAGPWWACIFLPCQGPFHFQPLLPSSCLADLRGPRLCWRTGNVRGTLSQLFLQMLTSVGSMLSFIRVSSTRTKSPIWWLSGHTRNPCPCRGQIIEESSLPCGACSRYT